MKKVKTAAACKPNHLPIKIKKTQVQYASSDEIKWCEFIKEWTRQEKIQFNLHTWVRGSNPLETCHLALLGNYPQCHLLNNITKNITYGAFGLLLDDCFGKGVCISTSVVSIVANMMYDLRNRKHAPCLYQVIEMRVEVWENKKCCGNTSHRGVFPQLLPVLPNFHKCFYNLIETQRTGFLFLLENTLWPKKENNR